MLLNITENFLIAMKDLGVSKAELAKRLGVSRASVTQMFRKDANWQISTIEKVAEVLGCEVEIMITPACLSTLAGGKEGAVRPCSAFS